MVIDKKLALFNIMGGLLISSYVGGFLYPVLPEQIQDSYLANVVTFLISGVLLSIVSIIILSLKHRLNTRSLSWTVLLPLGVLVVFGPIILAPIMMLLYFVYCQFGSC